VSMMRRVTQCGTFPLKSQGGGALLSGFQKVKVFAVVCHCQEKLWRVTSAKIVGTFARLNVGRK
jgi:hypothetical protein